MLLDQKLRLIYIPTPLVFKSLRPFQSHCHYTSKLFAIGTAQTEQKPIEVLLLFFRGPIIEESEKH